MSEKTPVASMEDTIDFAQDQIDNGSGANVKVTYHESGMHYGSGHRSVGTHDPNRPTLLSKSSLELDGGRNYGEMFDLAANTMVGEIGAQSAVYSSKESQERGVGKSYHRPAKASASVKRYTKGGKAYEHVFKDPAKTARAARLISQLATKDIINAREVSGSEEEKG